MQRVEACLTDAQRKVEEVQAELVASRRQIDLGRSTGVRVCRGQGLSASFTSPRPRIFPPGTVRGSIRAPEEAS